MENSKSHSKQHEIRTHQEQEQDNKQEQRWSPEKEQVQEQEHNQNEDQEKSTECIDEFSSFINKWKNDLNFRIRVDFGLLDAL